MNLQTKTDKYDDGGEIDLVELPSRYDGKKIKKFREKAPQKKPRIMSIMGIRKAVQGKEKPPGGKCQDKKKTQAPAQYGGKIHRGGDGRTPNIPKA